MKKNQTNVKRLTCEEKETDDKKREMEWIDTDKRSAGILMIFYCEAVFFFFFSLSRNSWQIAVQKNLIERGKRTETRKE